MSRIAITGASGLLGGNLAAELIAAGHEVVAIRDAIGWFRAHGML